MRSDQLGTGSIRRLFFSLSGPAIMAQIVTVVYNMVDRIFIGHLPDSQSMMAAIGVVSPVTLIVTAFSALLGSGGAPLCAIHLGKGEKQDAEHVMSNSFAALLISGLVMMFACLTFTEFILRAFGASDATYGYACDYLTCYVCGTLFVQISVGMNAYINTQGHARVGMMTVSVGALLNLALDPLFIYVLDMGVKGAALATVISQGASALLVLRFLFSSRSDMRIRPALMRPQWSILRRIMLLGISPFIMKLTESLLSAAFNTQLLQYGGDLAVSVMTIMNSVWQMAQLMTHGFTDGAQPILGFNFGAGKMDRVRSIFHLELVCCWGWTFLCAAAVMLAPDWFLCLFTAEESVLQVGPAMMRTYFLGMFVYGAFNACQQTYIALGNARSSLFFAVFRKVLLLIPLIYLFPMVFPGDKVMAVLAAEPAADITSTIINGLCFARFYRKKLHPDTICT